MMNSISMTRLTATICSAMGVAYPKEADPRPIPHVERLVEKKLEKKSTSNSDLKSGCIGDVSVSEIYRRFSACYGKDAA